MVNSALFSSKSDNWATPADFFAVLNAEFHFDLDVCASESNHKTPDYFDEKTDGLSQNWGGVGFSAIRRILKLKNGFKRRGRNHTNRKR